MSNIQKRIGLSGSHTPLGKAPTSLYGFDVSWSLGVRRYIAAWLHDPFVWKYIEHTNSPGSGSDNTKYDKGNTNYERFLHRELRNRQIEYVLSFKKIYDYKKNALQLFDQLNSHLDEKVKTDLCDNLFFLAYAKNKVLKKIEFSSNKGILTPAQRMQKMTEIMIAAAKGEIIFDGLLALIEALGGEFGICLHGGPEQIASFLRLGVAIGVIIWTMPITMSLLESVWTARASEGKTWGQVFKDALNNVGKAWTEATNNINAFHPFADAIIETVIIMIPWAIMCYYDCGYNYWMYAYMDTILMIKSKLLDDGWSSKVEFIKDVLEYSVIGYIRGLEKFWLMPKDPSALKMIIWDNLLTAVSSLTGRALHIFSPTFNPAK